MESKGCIDFLLYFALTLVFFDISMANDRFTGSIETGFQVSQMNWIDSNGLFLVSNSSEFGFGFATTSDVTRFLLFNVHITTTKVIRAANKDFPVSNSDMFVFQNNGDVLLQKGKTVVWTENTGEQGVSAMVLMDSGNLVLQRNDGEVIWESFAHPSDTLVSNQEFKQGMRLISNRSPSNLTYILEIQQGDMVLSAGYSNQQPYWSMGKDARRNIDKNDSIDVNVSTSWVAVLGSDGFTYFFNLNSGESSSTGKVPGDPCGTPEACMPNFVCSGSLAGNTKCRCPLELSSSACKTGVASSCGNGKDAVVLCIFCLLFVSLRYYKRKKTMLESLGGFGSVYRGTLPDGTQLTVKKLEGIGQGTKEFRAEVGIIGSIHHLHLVRLKGFSVEGSDRLLVYEYMSNGSLDKWIFGRNGEEPLLDWGTRINIAVGTAKGLAYLHEDCDAKIAT
ncbi:S-domain-2 5 isoform 2 [Hibiscus syriacus]|uniref:S-domain-2 5 isoform 2 n=1 Tax=Hibiscus syriacus TaxID=106335 RepID=A0A6A3CWL0_HIBSY|nr:S-domain-2 5 isoform 2 [Hibiscus syriacus]